METNQSCQPLATAAPDKKIVPLPLLKQERPPSQAPRYKFKIQEFFNRAGSKSWRVSGTKRDGNRIRENFSDIRAAQCRQIELEAEWFARHQESALRATRLTDTQIRLAEAALARLDADEELMQAVDYWRRHGKQLSVIQSPRLDDAVSQFCDWLEVTPTLRDRTKNNLRTRVNVFANSVGNSRVADVSPETIELFLDKRTISAVSKDNDRRALSRFFSWCIERPRHWSAINPCRAVRVERGEKSPPRVLTIEACQKLLTEAERYKDGRLAPYIATCLFAGVRPLEASRLTWDAVNLADGEIRLEATQTKTGRARVVAICPTLRAWLTAYKGREFYSSNWRKDFDAIKSAIGYGTPTEGQPHLKPWTPDILRHTGASHHFRRCGSYGQTAEQFGNSEAIIKRFYQGVVSSEQTKRFYALLPKKGAGK